ncbi:DNA polymerase domain-containing protein [Rubrivirga sp. IMCC43871]|uniref:DNA polymerase domain-containing protein n=1 Tax=Rubrivirga sp. IMCC43871 TaxID=3391575 RepID=UPI00398FF7B6
MPDFDPSDDPSPRASGDDALLYGHDPAEGLVALHPVGPATMRLYRRSGGEVTTEDVRVHPFVFLSDIELLKGFPRDRFQFQELAGPGYYRFAVAFPDRGAYFDALRHVQRATGSEKTRPDEVYTPGGPEQQYLMQTGRTLFKGMAFEDLRRLQLDLEVYSRDGFPQATTPEHRIILVALSDSTGWQRLVGAPGMSEEDVLRETLALVKERDPDVIEGHNIFGFDLPYLFERCRRHGIPADLGRDGSTPRSFPSSMRFAERQLEFDAVEIAGRHVIDTLHLLMAFDVTRRNLPNYTLKGAARYFGFAPEGRTYVPGDEIAEVWDTDPTRLMEYAIDDATETERLAAHLSGSTFYLTQMVPMSYGQGARTGPAAKIESLFVRGYLHARHALPRAEFGSQVVGGYTDVFVTGVVGPVVYADVESLYPSIMLNYDVQPKGDALGLFPRLLRRLTDLRFETKDAMRDTSGDDRDELDARQSAYKIVINCFAPDTEVLTVNGPKQVGDVQVGDLVYAIDPVSLVPALRPVEATMRQRYTGPMVEIVNQHVDFLVTPEHRFLTARFLPGGAFADYAWETAGDLLRDSVRRKLPPLAPLPSTAKAPDLVRVDDLCDRHGITYKRGPRGIKELRQQGRWQPGTFALDDWLAFIGWFASEGTLYKSTPQTFPSGHRRGEGYRITLCQKRDVGRDAIRALLDRMGIAYAEDQNGFGFSSRVFYEVLEAECGRGSYEKHLPPWVFGLPAERLSVLFESLMAGDGDAHGKRYTTVSRRLADDFVRLSLHLGRRSYVMSHDGAYRIAANNPTASVPKGLASVVKGEHRREVPYDGNVVCLTVAEHHTVLAGRNGRFNWCGQSFYGNMGFGYALFNDFAEADRVAATGQELLRQIMRLARAAGAKVIEVDTDGVLFVPPPEVEGEAAERAFVAALSEQMPEGIRIGFDGRFRRMLSYKKKNYALLTYDGDLKFKGSSLVSRSSERFGRAFVRETIRLLVEEDVAGLHALYLRHRRQIEAHDWQGVESFSRTETLKTSLADYRRAVAAGDRTRSAAYEVAAAEAERTGREPRIGDRVSYYIAEGGGRVFETATPAARWDPEAPDESTAFYLDRLDQLAARFAPFFETEAQFRLVFSEEDLFGFDPAGVRLVVRERDPDEVEDDVPF